MEQPESFPLNEIQQEESQTKKPKSADANTVPMSREEFYKLTMSLEKRKKYANLVLAKSQRLAVDRQYEENRWFYRFWPVFILLISLIEIFVYLGYYFTSTQNHNFWTYCAGCYSNFPNPGPLIFAPKHREEIWRFGSYGLLHDGFEHLIGNVLVQVLLGVTLEAAYGIWRIGPLYILAVVSGALLQYVFDPNIMIVGASGGVYALFTAHLVNVFINWAEFKENYRFLRIGIFGAYLSFDIAGTIYKRYFTDECDMTSNVSHFAGAITGLFFGVYILHTLHSKEDRLHNIQLQRNFRRRLTVPNMCIFLYACFLLVIITMTFIRSPGDTAFFPNGACRE